MNELVFYCTVYYIVKYHLPIIFLIIPLTQWRVVFTSDELYLTSAVNVNSNSFNLVYASWLLLARTEKAIPGAEEA